LDPAAAYGSLVGGMLWLANRKRNNGFNLIARALVGIAIVTLASFPYVYFTEHRFVATRVTPDGSIKKVDFYANGPLIGSASDVGTDRFMMRYRLQDGVHSLTAVATDELGVTSKSDPVKIKVGNRSPKP
jgi:hypothetical protein